MSPTDAGKSLTRAEKATSQDLNNPCLKEQRLSLKCLDDNGYDKKKCESFFVNYNVCQKFWERPGRSKSKFHCCCGLPHWRATCSRAGVCHIYHRFCDIARIVASDNVKLIRHHWAEIELSITKERKALGIEPALPPPEEREGIKRDRLRKAQKS